MAYGRLGGTLAIATTLALASCQSTRGDVLERSRSLGGEASVRATLPSDTGSTEAVPAGGARTTTTSPSAAAPAAAPQDGVYQLPEEGDWEFTVGGSGVNDEDFENGFASVAGYVGTYITDHLLVGVRQSLNYVDSGPSDDWVGSTRAALDFHFTDSNLRPFVGANFGLVYGESVDETFAAAPEAGLKWYLKDETFLMALVEYQFFFEEADDADEGFEDGNFVYTLAIGMSF